MTGQLMGTQKNSNVDFVVDSAGNARCIDAEGRSCQTGRAASAAWRHLLWAMALVSVPLVSWRLAVASDVLPERNASEPALVFAFLSFCWFVLSVLRGTSSPMMRLRASKHIAALCVSLLISAAVIHAFEKPRVFVDNASGEDVRIWVDGEHWISIANHAQQKSRLPLGAHELVLHSSKADQEIDRRAVVVDRDGPFILNVLGKQRYIRGTVHYSTRRVNPRDAAKRASGGYQTTSDEPNETTTTQVWIRANVAYVLEQPPESISVSKPWFDFSEVNEERSYLIRDRVEP
jgi:hypothetical protein